MIYLDDRLPTHPKILQCAEDLGPTGASRAFHLFSQAIGYARANMTDGFVSEVWVAGVQGVWRPREVARSMVRRGLFVKVRNGFRVHDFHDWNPTADQMRARRVKDAARKRVDRHGRNGNVRD